MSNFYEMTTEEILAELQRRKAGEAQDIRNEIAEHRKGIIVLEARLSELTGAKAIKAPKASGSKIPNADAEKAVLDAVMAADAPISAAKISELLGLTGAALKGALDRLTKAGSIIRTGKARATAYSAA